MTMEDLFFFSLERESDGFVEYRIAESFYDLFTRFGCAYMSRFCNIRKLNQVTNEHLDAINYFLSKVDN